MVTRLVATARARTHAGAALCVPVVRLASTLTHAAPAPHAPRMASGSCVARAISNVEAALSSMPEVTSRLSETDGPSARWCMRARTRWRLPITDRSCGL